ncbi:receptor-transporting protein 3 isoform 1-T2 [Thomomys bottae]
MDDLSHCYPSVRPIEEPNTSRDTMTAETTQNIEVWKKVFQELMQEVKTHKWTLELDKEILPNTLKPGWTQWQQKAFARFRCSSCSRTWASAQVLVLFHMRWHKKKRRGQVKMRVFAQRCKRCVSSQFEIPEFMPENVSRILNNLVLRILQKCYKEGLQALEEVSVIKDLELEGPHDTANCEACLQGFCTQTGSGLGVQLPSSPGPCGETENPRVLTINIPQSQPPHPQGDKILPSTVNPKSDPSKTHSKSQQTPQTQQVPSSLTVNPKSDPSKTHSKSQQTPQTQQVLSSLTVNPKSDPSKTHSKSQQTSQTQQVPSSLTVNPKSNLPKTDPRVSHTPKPSTDLPSPTRIVNPKVPIFPNTDPLSQYTSVSSTVPTRPTQQATGTSTVNPQISNPHKNAFQGYQISKAPPFPTQHMPVTGLSHLEPATQMGSPNSIRDRDENRRVMPGRTQLPYPPVIEPLGDRGPPHASTSCCSETCIQIDQACEQCLCLSRNCLCAMLNNPCRLFLVMLVIFVVSSLFFVVGPGP